MHQSKVMPKNVFTVLESCNPCWIYWQEDPFLIVLLAVADLFSLPPVFEYIKPKDLLTVCLTWQRFMALRGQKSALKTLLKWRVEILIYPILVACIWKSQCNSRNTTQYQLVWYITSSRNFLPLVSAARHLLTSGDKQWKLHGRRFERAQYSNLNIPFNAWDPWTSPTTISSTFLLSPAYIL